MIDVENMEQLIAAFVGILVVMGTAIFWLRKAAIKGEAETARGKEKRKSFDSENEVNESHVSGPQTHHKKKTRKNDRWKDNKKEGAIYDHPWCITTLKGHTALVSDCDFAPDGKKFVSISEDSGIFLWNVRDFESREHKTVMGKLECDRATHVAFAPDSKSLLLSMKRENKLAVYKLVKREDTGVYKFVSVESVDFPKIHNLDITHIGIASSGLFVFSACPEDKTVICSLKGDVLAKNEPRLNSLFHAALSPNAKFISMSGFSPDAFIYEVKFGRDGKFVSSKKVFNLKGADSGIFATVFNQDTSRAVTVSRDGYWRVYNTDIRYSQDEDAKIVEKGVWSSLKGANPEQVHLAVSPTGGSFVVAVGMNVKMFCAEDPSLEFDEMVVVHSSPISKVCISPCGKMVTTAGDKYIRVFNNIPEYHAQIVRLMKSIPTVTNESTKRRIQEQIDDARVNLKKMEKV